MSIEAPEKLLMTGLYSRSRNPMYVGWMLLYLGIGLAGNSVWTLAFLPLVMIFTHLVDVRKEERKLKNKFGEQYLEYQDKVRRYL
jgi:protein-S-isoprenylcysteine O-methyltransferase Ste14